MRFMRSPFEWGLGTTVGDSNHLRSAQQGRAEQGGNAMHAGAPWNDDVIREKTEPPFYRPRECKECKFGRVLIYRAATLRIESVP